MLSPLGPSLMAQDIIYVLLLLIIFKSWGNRLRGNAGSDFQFTNATSVCELMNFLVAIFLGV
jgi:hypothetical protein